MSLVFESVFGIVRAQMQIRKTFIVISALTAVIGFNSLIPFNTKREVVYSAPIVYANEEPIVIRNSPPPSIPTWLSIPGIDLETNIIEVGIAKDGKLDVPPNYTEVGWYKHGTLPGEIGSTILDGHVDNGAEIPGPFKNLKKIEKGDEISVEMENGGTAKYIVISKAIYDYKKFPGELVFHDRSGPLLKIITCHGTFIPSEDTYNQRLVVTAVLAP